MIARAAALAAAALLLGAAEAHADGETRVQGYASTFAALKPNVLGLTVNVFGPRNQIRISNYSGKTVVIRGFQGEPFLRLQDQNVYENLASPSVYVFGRRTMPAFASPDARPQWRKIARSASYTWHDHRILWVGKDPPPAVQKAPDEPHFLFRWAIPATADGKPFAITGFLGWAPPPKAPGGGASAWPIAGLVAAGVLVVAAVGLGARRVRRRAPKAA